MPKRMQKVTVEILQNDKGQQTASVSGPACPDGTLDPLVCSRVLLAGLDTLTAKQLEQRIADAPRIEVPKPEIARGVGWK